MPGFIGVGAGEWATPVPDAAVDVEVYLRGEGLTYKGAAPGTIAALGLATAGPEDGANLLASFETAGAVIMFATPGASTQRFESTDAGATWTETTPGTLFDAFSPAQLVGPRDVWAIDANAVKRSLDDAAFGVVAAAPAASTILDFKLTPTHLYALVKPDAADLSRVMACVLAGGALTEIYATGLLIGQVGDGVLACDLNDDVFTPAPIVRLVGTTPTATTGLPDTFISVGVDLDPGPLQTYDGVACKGTTAILGGLVNVPGTFGDSFFQLWRSADSGLSWTKVKEWNSQLQEKSGPVRVGYAGASDGVWWAGPVDDGAGSGGLWRSTDDGLTWTLVPWLTEGLSVIVADQVASSARPLGASA